MSDNLDSFIRPNNNGVVVVKSSSTMDTTDATAPLKTKYNYDNSKLYDLRDSNKNRPLLYNSHPGHTKLKPAVVIPPAVPGRFPLEDNNHKDLDDDDDGTTTSTTEDSVISQSESDSSIIITRDDLANNLKQLNNLDKADKEQNTSPTGHGQMTREAKVKRRKSLRLLLFAVVVIWHLTCMALVVVILYHIWRTFEQLEQICTFVVSVIKSSLKELKVATATSSNPGSSPMSTDAGFSTAGIDVNLNLPDCKVVIKDAEMYVKSIGLAVLCGLGLLLSVSGSCFFGRGILRCCRVTCEHMLEAV